MNFLSFSFAGFGILLFACWWALPSRFRPWVLAAANIIFAAFFGAKALICLGAITLIGYLFGLLEHQHKHKGILWLGVLACLVPLLSYKYLPVAALHFDALGAFQGLVAPAGISFYVFKSISYLAEIYLGRLAAERNLLHYFNYIGFFAQFSSGPIQRPNRLLPQLRNPISKFSSSLAFQGCVRLCWGFFLKKCLSDQFAAYQDALSQPEHYYGIAIVWSMLAYALYIYFDFASYSQLSIGVANLLGIQVEENFISPYFSRSIGEFWRRWHISLSSFLKDYIYIPLGGSRNGVPTLIAATMITFLASGAWHGATSGFLLWGALHGLYLLCGRATKPFREAFWRSIGQTTTSPLRSILACGCTFVLATIGWFFFQAGTLEQASLVASYLVQPFSLSLQYIKESFTQLGYTPMIMLRLGLFTAFAALIDWQSRKEGFGVWTAQKKPAILILFCYICIFSALFFGAAGTLQNIYFAF